jgi:capsular polysaccharide biosynthesis protein
MITLVLLLPVQLVVMWSRHLWQLSVELLKHQMDLRPVRNTELIEIRVSSDDPTEAAKLANTIAETFRDYRLDQNRLLKAEKEKANWRVTSYVVEIVDCAIAPAKPIRPNRPLASAVFVFGSLLIIFAIYFAAQGDRA